MKERKRAGPIFLRVLIGATLLIVVLILFWDNRPWKQRVTIEKMIARIPTVQTFVVEREELFNDVEEILQAHEQDFTHMNGKGEQVYFTPDRGGNYEALKDSKVFSEQEKEKIYAIFAEDGPVVSYNSSQFLLDEGEYSLDNLAELRLARVKGDDVEDWLTMTYYMEEVADDWYAYVTPCIYPHIFLDLEEYREQREDGGLVRQPG